MPDSNDLLVPLDIHEVPKLTFRHKSGVTTIEERDTPYTRVAEIAYHPKGDIDKYGRELSTSPYMYAVLLEIEWGDNASPYCPSCTRAESDGEHTHDCRLRAAMDYYEGKKSVPTKSVEFWSRS